MIFVRRLTVHNHPVSFKKPKDGAGHCLAEFYILIRPATAQGRVGFKFLVGRLRAGCAESFAHGRTTMTPHDRQRRFREIAAELSQLERFEVIDLKREADLLRELDGLECAAVLDRQSSEDNRRQLDEYSETLDPAPR